MFLIEVYYLGYKTHKASYRIMFLIYANNNIYPESKTY